MARARNIKPGFFTNDLLAECCPLARILFAGLWCIADREGRLEDRSKRIKAQVLPYDDCDADALLQELAVRGFLLRYQVDGAEFIQVLNFDKHQNPHVKEQASTIPAPCKPGASPVQATDKPETSTEDAGLIPDSLNLIPDSPKKSVRKEPRTAFVKPSVEEVADYCMERNNGIDAEHFVDHYTGNGWKVGSNKMVDWKAAVRTWEKKQSEFSKSSGSIVSSKQLFAGVE